MPDLARRHAGQFDLIFIDGWHTFDHTLLDCFCATRLLRVGGYLLIDDTGFLSVSKVVRELATYPCYVRQGAVGKWRSNLNWKGRLVRSLLSIPPFSRALPYLSHRVHHAIGTRHELTAFKKCAEDRRNSDWYGDDVRSG